MKKLVIPMAFVLALLTTLLGGLAAFPSQTVHAAPLEITASPTATASTPVVQNGTIQQVQGCVGAGDGFFNLRNSGSAQWYCFANAGTVLMQIPGINELCTGNNTGSVDYTYDATRYITASFNQRYTCYTLGGYKNITSITIN